MKYSIRLLALLIFGIASISFGPYLFAETASLLPNAVQQFFDNSGNPLTQGTVTTYVAGTHTLKKTWKDSAEATPNTNPISLDGGGKAIIYGNGVYRQVVKDRNGNLIWDAVTAPGGGGATPTLVGDGNLVGTIIPWSGLVAPNQYVFAAGQEIARATYPDFYTATTQLANVICSISSNTLTGLADTTQISIGSPVELICMPAGTTVVSKTAATVVLSNPSNISINTTAVFFPWGNGNGTTTFNVPDLRGYVMAGRDNMGGTAASRLTTTYYGSNTPDALGAAGGAQSHTMTISEMALHTHIATVNDPGHFHTLPLTTGDSTRSPSGPTPVNGGSGVTGTSTTGITVSNASAGSSTPFSIIQPTITLNYIVKITPDTSASVVTGVASLGGMTGVIACGSGLLCTGNIVSVNSSTFAAGVNTNVQYNVAGAFGGSPNFNFISPDNLTLGGAGVTAKFDIYGSSSGVVRQIAQDAAGTPTVTWGTSSGTPAVTVTSPLALNITTGNLSITASALTKVDDTNVTLTLGGTPTTSLLQATSLTLGWTGQLSVGRGGTGLGSGTSGGIPYFNSTSTIASSALLTANQIMIGGGAGAAPTTFACATVTTVVHGGTPPTCSQIVAADITTNTVANSNLVQAIAATLKGNPTSGTANVQDFTVQGLTNLATPSATLDFIPIYDHTSGTIKNVTPGAIATSSVAGVASLNTLTGALTVTGSNGIVTNSVGSTITITPDTATASNFFAGTANKLLDASVVFSSETTTTYGTTTSLDFNTFINTKVTLTGNITTLNCSNMKASQSGMVTFIQDATGSRTAAFNTGTCSSVLKFANATFPTLTISAIGLNILNYSCRSSTYCEAALSGPFNP